MTALGVRAQSALAQVGTYLRDQRYGFVTVTPSTHARYLKKRGDAPGANLRDVFGWNLAFSPELLPAAVLSLLDVAGCLMHDGPLLRSSVRFATLDEFLFAHSSYPTLDPESVFFGPDTYRFVNFIRQSVGTQSVRSTGRLVDIGTGSGAGGLIAASLTGMSQPILTDISDVALTFARCNARLAHMPDCRFERADLLSTLDGHFDLILSNPPYMKDSLERAYRDGGENYGAQLSERILRESLPRLAPGGQLILYTGVATVEGNDVFAPVVASTLAPLGWPYRYSEIDPDVFGEEIEQPNYAPVERLAAVGLAVTRPF